MKDEHDNATIDTFEDPQLAVITENEVRAYADHLFRLDGLAFGGHYRPVLPPTDSIVSGRRWHGSKTPDKAKPCWSTPDWLVAWQAKRYTKNNAFDLDVAADEKNKKAPNYYDKALNGLAQPWDAFGDDVFCNPPYDAILPWVEKAVAECKRAKNLTVCMVLPNDNSTAWYRMAAINAAEVVNIISDGKASGRVGFVNALTGEPVKDNNKGTNLFIFKSKKRICKTTYVSRTRMEAGQDGA